MLDPHLETEMKRLSLLTIGMFLLVTQARATLQSPDIAIHDGVVYKLHDRGNQPLPLETLWRRDNRPRLSEGPGGIMSSALWRGYVAIWEVADGHFFRRGAYRDLAI